jgi:hypothetical protein
MSHPAAGIAPSHALSAVREVFEDCARHSRILSNAELEDAHGKICSVVHELKAGGMLPEHIIINVRQLALDAGLSLASNQVLENLARWCLEQYYRD